MSFSLSHVSLPVAFRDGSPHAGNVIVAITDGQGRVGLGEGCPNADAAGETVHAARVFLALHAEALSSIDTVDALKAWIAKHEAEIDCAPAAFCAAELALIDLLARRAGVSVEAKLGIAAHVPPRAGAVYRTSSWLEFQKQALAFRLNGLRSSRLDLTGDMRDDVRRARRLGGRDFVRLNAGNRWPDAKTAIEALLPLRDHAWAVEEPVKPGDWAAMTEIRHATGLSIIANRSLLRPVDLEAMPAGRDFIPCITVSRQGGLLRSLDLLAHARSQGRAVIVGAEPGETSILARAGLALATAAHAALITSEIAHGAHLLTADAVAPSLGFGRYGVIDTTPFDKSPGWGLGPTPALSAALATRMPSAA